MNKVLIIDTSILCVWLNVPGMEDCGPDNDRWDRARVDTLIQKEIKSNSTLVLPLATIIETGNHISQSEGDRFATANNLCDLIRKAAEQQTPWAAFTDQSSLWNSDGLIKLANEWPELAVGRLSIGDMTIVQVAEYYVQANYEVEILTGDQGLKSYEPKKQPLIPRRRK